MMLRVAIIGGYGNFGGYVARALAPDPGIALVICGRDLRKAITFADGLNAANPAIGRAVDIGGDPAAMLGDIGPDLVINMVGPYHTQGYAVAEAAIAAGADYCDIADAREFVCGIGALDEAAKTAGVTVLAGASSVPALTAAFLDEAAKAMQVRHVHYGISGAEQANRGAGTVAAVTSYVGQRFTRLKDGAMRPVTGWSGLHAVRYPELGRRWFAHGNVPDLGLFPDRYPTLRSHAFYAGHEINVLHFGTWISGKLVRIGLLPRLDRYAGLLVRFAALFNWLGKGRSGFHMVIEGEGTDGTPMTRRHWIIARQGHGPIIPCIPVILIARMMAEGRVFAPGARPCLDIITLDAYRAEFAGLDITAIDE